MYYPWAEWLPAPIEVCPVELPGRSTRLGEPLYYRLEPLIESAARGLAPYFDKPFALFGHSLGALISFELARYLRHHLGITPIHLFVSGHQAPHILDNEPPIHNLPEDEFSRKISEFNGMPDELLANAELMELFIPILKADFEMCETYTFKTGEKLSCPISAYGGLADRHVTRQDLEAWREHTSHSFVLKMFPGDHFYLQANRSLLLQAIAQELHLHFKHENHRKRY